MPSRDEMERLAAKPARSPVAAEPAPQDALPDEYWQALLADPRAVGKPWLPIQQRRLSEIPRELLRVACLRCFRTVEIRRLDAIRLYGPHATWRAVGERLLADGCQVRTGRLEEDGSSSDKREERQNRRLANHALASGS
jgi:hypothetical protein